MNYYLTNLGAHLVIISALIAVICIFADKVRKRKLKNIVLFFLPVVLTVLVIWYACGIVIPRLYDIRNVVNNNFSSVTGTVDSVAPLKNYIKVDGVIYYKNPSKSCPAQGDVITLRYTETSRFMPEWKLKD